MKSYSIIHALLFLGIFVSSKIEVSSSWSDQFIEIQSSPDIILSEGQTRIATIEVTALDEYHIMADQMDNDNFQFTRLEIVAGIEGITIGAPQFPAPNDLTFGENDFTMRGYSGDFEIQLPVDIRAGARAGLYQIHCTLYYQPCDVQKCYFPREAVFFIQVEVR